MNSVTTKAAAKHHFMFNIPASAVKVAEVNVYQGREWNLTTHAVHTCSDIMVEIENVNDNQIFEANKCNFIYLTACETNLWALAHN